MDIVYRHIEFVTWILSFVTLLLSIVASMLSLVHHRIARPLGPPYDDAEGIDQPLTPADLIYGRQIATSPSDRQFDMMNTAKTLMKRAKYQFRILEHLHETMAAGLSFRSEREEDSSDKVK